MIEEVDGPFQGNDPAGKKAAMVMNSLYKQRGAVERVEGLFWILGDEELWAIRMTFPGSQGVEYHPATGVIRLFGLPVYRCVADSVRVIAKNAQYRVEYR